MSTDYFEDGLTPRRIDHYYNGKVDGVHESFFRNGRLSQSYVLVDGKKHGMHTFFTDEGKLYKTNHWSDGNLVETVLPSN